MSFSHHNYQHVPDEGGYELIPSDRARPIEDPQPADVPLAAVQRYHRAQVRRIMLIHGTFVGNDALGLIREISRVSPAVGKAMRAAAEQIVKELTGDLGNYTDSFATCLGRLVNQGAEPPVDVSIFHWSGENHHLGRAEAAISLLDHLSRTQWTAGERVLLWGHSHAGNVLALLSNLLGATGDAREAFFQATRLHYRMPLFGRSDLPTWERARAYLEEPTQRPELDIVTFGTPLRYRWNTHVCAKLLHFVHHRPLIEACSARAAMPGGIEDVLAARGGDYVQQLGIAGTNFPHYIGAWRSWRAERKLTRLLQPGVRNRDLLQHLRKGLRVSLDGMTLLVDYAATEQRWETKAAGHAVYTRPEWLPFHLREIASHLYADAAEISDA